MRENAILNNLFAVQVNEAGGLDSIFYLVQNRRFALGDEAGSNRRCPRGGNDR
jgi:hypothetical protein